jgi:hypothetical protein
MAHHVASKPTTTAASQWQSRTGAASRVGKVLVDDRRSVDNYEAILAQCQFGYNWHRRHSTLGVISIERIFERQDQTPCCEDVEAGFYMAKEAERLCDVVARDHMAGRDHGSQRRGRQKTAPAQRLGTERARTNDARSAITSSPSAGSRSP